MNTRNCRNANSVDYRAAADTSLCSVVPDMHASSLPPMIESLHDGVTILLDYRRSRNTNVKAPCDFLHGQAATASPPDRDVAMLTEDSEESTPPPLASVFVTMDHARILAKSMITDGSSSLHIALHTSNGSYSHAVLEGEKREDDQMGHAGGTHARVTLCFVPTVATAADVGGGSCCALEEGEIPAPALPEVRRSFTLVTRPHGSYMREVHDPAETMYVHGLRKAVSYVAWGLCVCPPCNQDLPIVPPGITPEESVMVIQAMRLELGVPAVLDTEDGDQQEAAGGGEGQGNVELYHAFRSALDEDANGTVHTMGVKEVPVISRKEATAAYAALGKLEAMESIEKHSVYPVGILGPRQMGLVPGTSVLGNPDHHWTLL